MTESAQQAMRRTMELYSSTTRFALACNQSTKIIEPIQSRCAILRYTRLTNEQICMRLLQVMQAENVSHDAGGMEALLFTADGDMRNALNNLQSTVTGFGMVNKENVLKVCDQPHPDKIKRLVESCKKGEWAPGYQVVEELWKQGYSGLDIIGTIFRVLKTHDLPEHMKLAFIKEVGTYHMRMAEGVSSTVQLGGLVAALCQHAYAGGK
eukprot:GDKI01019327.1.p1 GENE.GDKI01019327.1~~GDKI01019327.1.p1  ORF type:complete len:209 (-),score=60.87 GDKI01019327.1:111-737(-)